MRGVASLVLVILSTVSGAATGQVSQPSDACGLFTLEEAGKATGRTFRRARLETQPGQTSCAFIGGTEGNINVTWSPSSSPRSFQDFRALLKEQGETVDAASGVGDEVFYWGSRIHVRIGNQTLVIWNGDPNQPVERVRAHVLALARMAVGKLK